MQAIENTTVFSVRSFAAATGRLPACMVDGGIQQTDLTKT